MSYEPLAHKNALLLVKLVSRALGTAASTPSCQRATTSHLHKHLDLIELCRIQLRQAVISRVFKPLYAKRGAVIGCAVALCMRSYRELFVSGTRSPT